MIAACLALLLGHAASGTALAQEPGATKPATYSEYQVKAAFLYNFAKFTKWPSGTFADASAPLVVCVLGKDPFGKALDALAGKRINGRPVAVSRLAGVEEAWQCHVVFISEPGSKRLFQDLGRVESRPLLTVGDSPGFARAGGVIGLKIVDDRIKFEINVTAARIKGLWFDARLLRLADVVYIANARSR